MNNPLQMIVQGMQRGVNPLNLMAQMAPQNPKVAQTLQMIRGKSPDQLRSMAQNMAQERGINPQDILRQLGLMK